MNDDDAVDHDDDDDDDNDDDADDEVISVGFDKEIRALIQALGNASMSKQCRSRWDAVY